MDQFEKRHLAVNWVDGMLINSNHFQQLEKSIVSRIAQPAGLYTAANKYGLIPDAYNQLTFELDWDASVNTLQVKHCKGVTPGGWVIDVFPELEVKISPDISKMERESSPHPEGLWAILLHIQPDEPYEVGIPDPSETSRTGTRLPYTVPKYSLELLPTGSNKAKSGSHTLLIGMFKLESSNLYLLPYKTQEGSERFGYFIPPCINISSNPILAEIHKSLKDKLVEIHEFAIQRVKNMYKDEINAWDSSLVIPMKTIAEDMARYLSMNIGPFRLLIPEQPPVNLVSYCVQFAQSFDTSLELLKPKNQQDVLNFLEVKKLSPENLRKKIGEISTLKYSHEDIAASVSLLEDKIEMVHKLFKKMVNLEPKWKDKIIEEEGSSIVEARKEPKKEGLGGIKIHKVD